jgi:hypothetical protein
MATRKGTGGLPEGDLARTKDATLEIRRTGVASLENKSMEKNRGEKETPSHPFKVKS